MTVYGNGTYACVICGQSDPDVLTLDHINDNGSKERKLLKLGCREKTYRYLIEANFPPGYQTLCANCNWKKRSLSKRGDVPPSDARYYLRAVGMVG